MTRLFANGMSRHGAHCSCRYCATPATEPEIETADCLDCGAAYPVNDGHTCADRLREVERRHRPFDEDAARTAKGEE